MAPDTNRKMAEAFSAAAALPLDEKRLAQLAFGLIAARTAAAVVLSQPLGAIEPASRFEPPPPAVR